MQYIMYMIDVLEPLKIVDSGTSRNGEITTLHYIPGSTIRGVVMNHLVSKSLEDFEHIKKILLSDKVGFQNAYPYINDNYLIPSPLGFYENKKQDGNINNSIALGNFSEGDKRAAIGEFGIIENSTFQYMSVSQGDSLNINVADHNIFRYEYINPPCVFAGVIAMEDQSYETHKDLLQNALNGLARIGGKKSSGYGKVKFSIMEGKHDPYFQYSICKDETPIIDKEVYMMCLSPLAMLDKFGENCGIDLEMLAVKMGVKTVEIISCATSIVTKTGMNNVWKSRTPEYKMYVPGSIFKLKCSQPPEIKYLQEVQDNGLGVCKNEGCGKVVFLKRFDKIVKKNELVNSQKKSRTLEFSIPEKEVEKLNKISAKGMLNAQLKYHKQKYLATETNQLTITSGQTRIVIALCNRLRYSKDVTEIEIEFSKYFDSIKSRIENQKVHILTDEEKKAATNSLIHEIMGSPLKKLYDGLKETYCGFCLEELLPKEEEMKIKLDLILAKISAENRKSKGGQ